jgi:hypothetical protein
MLEQYMVRIPMEYKGVGMGNVKQYRLFEDFGYLQYSFTGTNTVWGRYER